MAPPDPRPSAARLTLFASGDFACNLYWQSVSLFLLFFYTDVLGLPPALAGLVYMAGAVWDGLADLVVGMVAQRGRTSYRRFVGWGALPLGLAFVALYASGLALAALLTQIGFRTLYALVNVPYAAWSARISADSRDRTTLAGLRMLFGALAAILVALGTPWIALHLAGDPSSRTGYLLAALLFAALAVPLLLVVAHTAPEALPQHSGSTPAPLRACWRTLARNRAFVTLNLAAAAAGVAAALLNQSVLYYFKHVLVDTGGGPRTLAMMGLAGTLSVPVWMAVTRRFEVRWVWFAAAAIGLGAAAAFALSGPAQAGSARAFLLALQIVFTGFNLGFWAMLPDTVEYGERCYGVRVEAMAFGVAALVQKIALAAAAGSFGLAYARIGYVPGAVQSPATLAGIHALMLVGPAIGLVVSAIAMAANPLKRGVHAAIVAELAADPNPTPPAA